MAAKSEEVIDLTQMSDEQAQTGKALVSLKRNLSHLLISSMEETGPEIDFGPDKEGTERVLKFKAKVPATAMVELVGNPNKIDGLRSYIRLALQEECRPLFEDLLDDIPLEGLNSIVEVISEASTSFPTK